MSAERDPLTKAQYRTLWQDATATLRQIEADLAKARQDAALMRMRALLIAGDVRRYVQEYPHLANSDWTKGLMQIVGYVETTLAASPTGADIVRDLELARASRDELEQKLRAATDELRVLQALRVQLQGHVASCALFRGGACDCPLSAAPHRRGEWTE